MEIKCSNLVAILFPLVFGGLGRWGQGNLISFTFSFRNISWII